MTDAERRSMGAASRRIARSSDLNVSAGRSGACAVGEPDIAINSCVSFTSFAAWRTLPARPTSSDRWPRRRRGRATP